MKTDILTSETHTKICYFKQNDVCDTILILDTEHKLIQIEISEYDEHGKRLAERVYGADGVSEIAHRLYDEDGWRDFRKINGEWVLTQWTRDEWLVPDQLAKCSWYNGQNELVCYDIFERDPDLGMILAERYTPNDEPFYFAEQAPPPEKWATLQRYTDY